VAFNRVEAFNLFDHYNFPQYFFFFLNLCFLLPWPLCNLFCNGALNHYCNVLRSSLGISYGVFPLQFNELLESDPLLKDNLVLSLIFFTSNLFFTLVGASASSSFFTKHTSPTSCFLCGSLRNRNTSSNNDAHHAILWNGIHWTMFFLPFFSK